MDGDNNLIKFFFALYSISTHVILGVNVFNFPVSAIPNEHGVFRIVGWTVFLFFLFVFLLSACIPALILEETSRIYVNTSGRNGQQKRKIRLYFGYGLLIFVGCLANFLILKMEHSMKDLILCFITFTLHGFFSLLITFPKSKTDEFELVPQQFRLVDGAIFMIYSFAILELVKSGAQESENFRTFLKIWFSMFVLWGIHGIWQAWNGTIVMKGDTVSHSVQRTATVRQSAMTHATASSTTQTPIEFETLLPSRPECKICFREYTETSRIPRILKECYHTACQACLDRLLAQNNYKYVQCPFCQVVTGVTGPARQLPKNYAVLDTIQG